MGKDDAKRPDDYSNKETEALGNKMYAAEREASGYMTPKTSEQLDYERARRKLAEAADAGESVAKRTSGFTSVNSQRMAESDRYKAEDAGERDRLSNRARKK